jgi:phage FluMu protein Com
MKEIRCKNCDRLLFKISEYHIFLTIETKCEKCKFRNIIRIIQDLKHSASK